MRRTRLFLLLLALAASCETVKGFGNDVEHLGDEIEEAADGR